MFEVPRHPRQGGPCDDLVGTVHRSGPADERDPPGIGMELQRHPERLVGGQLAGDPGHARGNVQPGQRLLLHPGVEDRDARPEDLPLPQSELERAGPGGEHHVWPEGPVALLKPLVLAGAEHRIDQRLRVEDLVQDVDIPRSLGSGQGHAQRGVERHHRGREWIEPVENQDAAPVVGLGGSARLGDEQRRGEQRRPREVAPGLPRARRHRRGGPTGGPGKAISSP